MSSDTVFAFGPYRLIPARRALLSDGKPVKLGGRALDMLHVLVERRDRVVGKNELLDLVWPGLVVEENNLQVQVLALRKLLGHPAIATVPGRGYRFTLPVLIEGPAGAAPAAPASSSRSGELIGRDDDLRALQALLDECGLVTLAGAGGIGKTRLAQGLVQRQAAHDSQQVCWVELTPLADPALIASAVGRAIGVPVDGTPDPTSAVIAALRGRAALLVLDNAEHLLGGVAAFVAAVHAQVPSIKLLITSQEVLRVVDEHVFRASPLALPESDDLAAASASGAVALFVARARAVDPRFVLSRSNVEAVVDICRRLDGIPLAIELAAARVPLLGIEGLRARLDERFNVLTAGARVALRKHQTLRAALTWSHDLLSPPEQVVYRRLGVFVGGFALEAAQHAVADDAIDPWDVLEHLGSLVDKSLVLAEGQGAPRYRMLETTRLFALERLADAGETEQQLGRHAQAMVATLAPRGAEPKRWRVTREEFEADAIEVDNVRAAIVWASDRDNARLAIEVAAECGLAYVRADLMNEYADRAVRLRPRINDDIPRELAGLYWLRLANAGTKSASAAAWAAAQQAVEILRPIGDNVRLFEALAHAIAIGSNRADLAELQPLVDEAAALDRSEWAPALRSYHRWALHRWAQRAGRHEEALQHALANLELSALRDPVFARRLEGDLVVQAEIALGRLAQAEARARAVLQALGQAGVPDSRLGPVYEGLALALVMQGQHDAALPMAREAYRRLRADNDDLRLLEPLALSAASRGHCEPASRIAGHVDAALRHSGAARWPAVAERRSRLDAMLAAALSPAELADRLAAGAMLTREQAFELAFAVPRERDQPALR